MVRYCLTLMALATAAALCGCRGSFPLAIPTGGVTAERQERSGQAIQQFEQYRDAAQLEAALDRWQQNDIAGCETRLRTLIVRRPDFLAARLRLAELAWSFGDAAEAETQYRAALGLAADRPDIHHALGLVLEATGRVDEAHVHFVRAAEIAPDDEVLELVSQQ
jgi:Tfp pilus assembly protein PilF